MSLISGKNIVLAFGSAPVFSDMDFTVQEKERLCIVGRNGAGKSTFLKLLNQDLFPDEGQMQFQKNLKVAMMDQFVPEAKQQSCYEVIAQGLEGDFTVLTDYRLTLKALEDNPEDSKIFENLQTLQSEIDKNNLWDIDHAIQKTASLLEIDPEQAFSSLSGGRRRRVWLARALVSEPDVLLLDEPTNHLDLETVLWLEGFLKSWQGTIVFISHDRSFITALATRIIDIDRGKTSSWPGDYQTYLERKAQALDVEAEQNKLFDKKLAQEEIWVRQGIKARRTRNEGRVRALKALRQERKSRIDRQGSAKIEISLAEKSSKLVVEANAISCAFDDGKTVFKDFTTTIFRDDKIGVIGPNGIGKTTLVKVLLGEIEASSGQIKRADNLRIAYFDQLREGLNLQKNIIDNVAEGSDFIELGEKKTHIVSWLKDFLFSAERLHTPLEALSGGERNRVLLAKLFSKPSNVLVLDEPTNDLDIETLELLEEKLALYPGTVILISHDRSFLNNVATSTYVFEDGQLNEYVGGYDDWLMQRDTSIKPSAGESQRGRSSQASLTPEAEEKSSKPQKLSYKQQRALEQLPKDIEQVEREIEQINTVLSDPESYQSLDGEMIAKHTENLKSAEARLEQLFDEWSELEALQESLA